MLVINGSALDVLSNDSVRRTLTVP